MPVQKCCTAFRDGKRMTRGLAIDEARTKNNIPQMRLVDAAGRNILDFIDLKRYTILPNTAGCFTADDAVRTARLGREILLGLENPGANWIKLEVLADKKTLLPDPVATLEATKQLVADGFEVLCYSSDDPIIARRLKEAGATSVMPAGSPIGSGQGVLNPNNIRICLEYLKENDPTYPVIIDAGVNIFNYELRITS